ncbi:unnamed protein product [Heterobilharzia americana]|nr:unnamed protein product [Heterobilharzia americana]
MPNNNNNNNNNERSENVSLPRSVTTTGQQQQQLTRLSVKDKSNSLNVHFQQKMTDKSKFVDARRTTPRQLKQHQSKRGHLILSSSTASPETVEGDSGEKSLFNHSLSEKSRTTGNYHSSEMKPSYTQQTHPSDIASSLIRTASLHLKTTLSRLKRSNSGHANKTLDTTTANTTTTTAEISSTDNVDDSTLRRCSVPYANKSMKLVTKECDRGLDNDSNSLSPGCTKWSTRLGPPPPCTVSTAVVSSSNLMCPKCTSLPTYTTTITTTNCTRIPVSGVNEQPLDKSDGETRDCSLRYPYTTTSTVNTTTRSRNADNVMNSLPVYETNEISILPDDCVDFGTFGRINFRTGSFMGRYPNYSRSNQLQQHSRGQHSNIQHYHQQHQRLPEYRPLYLSVQQHTLSSGNTTRSAPSPSLSSITSTHGVLSSPVYQEQINQRLHQYKPGTLKTSSASSITLTGPIRISKGYSMHKQQTMSGGHMYHLNSDDYSIPIQYQDILSASRINPHPALDPILARLLSDVTSIDEYRSTLQPHGSVTPPSSLANQRRNANQLHIPLASSDPESISRSAERLSGINLSAQQNIMDDVWDLNKQIGDLIQMEFDYRQKQPTTLKSQSPHGTLISGISTIGPRSSAPNVRVEEKAINDDDDNNNNKDRQQTDGIFQTIKPGKYSSPRKHPFRWSSRSRPSHKKIMLAYTQSSAGGDQHFGQFVNKDDSISHLSSSSLQYTPTKSMMKSVTSNPNNNNIKLIHSSPINFDDPSVHQSLGSSRRGTLNTSVGVNNTEILLHEARLEREEEYATFWSLSVGQLTILRKLASIQLASLAEKHCSINRSPFSWRFMRYRALLTSGDSNLLSNTLTTSPLPEKKSVTSPNGETSKLDSVESNNVPCQSQSPTSEHIQQSPLPNVSYTGPVFGQSLSSWQRRLGYPLPPAVVHMMDHLEMNGTTAHGIFRRPGGKLRMLALREEIEQDINWKKFDDWQPYDIADLLKQFFRELPECLFTSKLATVLVNVYVCVPNSVQIDLLRWILISLPDENRVVLQKLLYLLNHLSRHSDVTEMSASNLAVCFAPSLYRLIKPPTLSNQGVSLSPRRLRRTTSGPDPKDLADQRAAQLSLSAMITLAPSLFQISCSLLNHSTLLTSLTPSPPDLESIIPNGDWPQWIQNSLSDLIRECSSSKSKGWNVVSRDAMKCYGVDSGANELLDGFEVHYKKVPNSTETKATPNNLRLWRCSIHIPESSPRVILNRFSQNRTSWDPEVVQMKIVDQISDCVELCELHMSTVYPQPKCILQLLRGLQYTLDDGSCAMLCESLTSSVFQNVHTTFSLSATSSTGAVNQCTNTLGHVYEDHVYIRPASDGQGCRVYLLSRVDLKGYGPDWYMNQWGHTLCRRLINLKRSFQKQKTPVLVYELEETIPRPSPPPYTSVTITSSSDTDHQTVPTTSNVSSRTIAISRF